MIGLNVEKAFHTNYEDVDLEGLIEPKNKRWLDPTVVTSMIAVNEAVEMSGLDFPDDTPVFVGTIRGGAPNLARYGQILHQQKRKVIMLAVITNGMVLVWVQVVHVLVEYKH